MVEEVLKWRPTEVQFHWNGVRLKNVLGQRCKEQNSKNPVINGERWDIKNVPTEQKRCLTLGGLPFRTQNKYSVWGIVISHCGPCTFQQLSVGTPLSQSVSFNSGVENSELLLLSISKQQCTQSITTFTNYVSFNDLRGLIRSIQDKNRGSRLVL